MPIDQLIMSMIGGSVLSPSVSRTAALSVPAVLRGRNLLCSIATLPLEQLGPDRSKVPNPLLAQVDPDIPNTVTLAQTVEDLLFVGESYWRILGFGWDGYPVSAMHLDYTSVSVTPPTDRNPAPLPSGLDPRDGSVVWVDGVEVGWDELIRFDSPNPGLLNVGGRTINRALLIDQVASLYSKNPRPLDYFSPADGVDPASDTEIASILSAWATARQASSTAYVPAALKYNSVDSPTPQEMQLVELAKQATLDLANLMGVDPEDLGVSTTSRTYQNAVDRRQDMINTVFAPYLRAITDRLSMGDVTKRGYRVEFDLDDYLKPDPQTRWTVYQTAKGIGALTVDEIRARECLPDLTPAQRAELNPPTADGNTVPAVGQDDPADEAADDQAQAWRPPMVTLGRYRYARATFPYTIAKDTEHCPASKPWALRKTDTGELIACHETKEKAVAQQSAIGANNHSSPAGARFIAVPVQNFRVDVERRIIEGLALPYGRVADNGGGRFRFAKGALRYTDPGRVKLFRDHDYSQALGRMTDARDTDEGVFVRYKVARGQAGDEALALAEDGVLDGLSVGVDFSRTDTGPDPENKGVTLVRRATWRETSLTAMPAFDDARLTSVTASRKGAAVPAEEENTEATEETAPEAQQEQPQGVSLSQEQLTALLSRPGALDALVQPAQQVPQPPAGALTLSAEQVDGLIKSGRLGALLGVPSLQASAPREERRVVNPGNRRPAAATQVREELPYRFDRRGNLTSGPRYDFSTDLISGLKDRAAGRSSESLDRAEKFMRENFAASVDTGDTSTLNPNVQRPDLYVDQKDFLYPLWSTIAKGPLSSITPFVFPKFNSASGLVGAHTEGTEPTPGSFTATSATVTPAAISGKVTLSREAWDQGGNPQTSGLIWRQMTRGWYEALEASVVTLLNGTTLTAQTITIAAGESDTALTGELEGALAALNFARGGFTMREFFIQADLYSKLIAAVDDSGRKVYPIMGPTNATGTTADFFGNINIAGVRGRPTWALAAAGQTAATPSYLIDPNDVWGWASAPQRLDFQYQVATVDIGIWGYHAAVVSDVTGVRKVMYDPTTGD